MNTQQNVLILSDNHFEAISERLLELHREIGSRCIILADMQGQRLAEVGDTKGFGNMLALLAGGFATSGALARQFGDGQALNLNFHEGSRYDIYSANVGNGFFLAIVYGRQAQGSRVGIVWLYTRRAVEELIPILAAAAATAPDQSLDVNFGSSLTAELDMLFTKESLPDTLPQKGEEHDAATVQSQPAPAAPSDGEEQEVELFDLDTAIARGIVPAELDKRLQFR